MTCLNPNTTKRARSVFIQVYLSFPTSTPTPAPVPAPTPTLSPAPSPVSAIAPARAPTPRYLKRVMKQQKLRKKFNNNYKHNQETWQLKFLHYHGNGKTTYFLKSYESTFYVKNKENMTKQHEKVFHTMKVNNKQAIEAQNKGCNMLK